MFEEIKINPQLEKQYLEKGYWSRRTLLDCWEDTVKRFPDREYLADDRGFRYTYRSMDETAGRIAAFLRERGDESRRCGLVPAAGLERICRDHPRLLYAGRRGSPHRHVL